MVNDLTPQYLSSLVPSTVNETSRYNLRNSNGIRTVNTRTSQYYNSLLPSTIREWNALPEEQRNFSTVVSFKFHLNQHAPTYRNFIMSEIDALRYYMLDYALNAVLLNMISTSEILQIHLFAVVEILKTLNTISYNVVCITSPE